MLFVDTETKGATSTNMISILQIFVVILSFHHSHAEEARCEPMTVDLCANVGYNETIFPNMMGHTTQEEAGLEISQYFTLLTSNCSPYLKPFLCSAYIPMCSEINLPFPPCRHLCEDVKRGCERLMNYFDFNWPLTLKCDRFPVRVPNELCFGPDVSSPRVESCVENDILVCPQHMVVPTKYNVDYTVMNMNNCGAPCEDNKLLYWNGNERQFARVWVACWSFVCLISTLFTVLTYLIDIKRFSYPERPIVFLSGCYLIVSVAYITGFLMYDKVSCKQYDNVKVVTQETSNAGCTTLFMMIYFFSMASSIWWVILTVTWFLAAGLKWGNEAIEQKSPYFHGVAWAVPAIQTLVVLLRFRIEGDILSGVCYVGIHSYNHILWALLVPLSSYLFVGTGFLIAGFISMYNIRNVVKSEAGTNKVEKLEKLMVRIGIFSVLYTVPATVTIVCYFYEYFNKESWQRGWLARNCHEYKIPCPCNYNEDLTSTPNFVMFIVKYFMTLIVGITSGVWIWSGKTFESWIEFKDRVFCKKTSYQRGAIQHKTTDSIPIVQHHTARVV